MPTHCPTRSPGRRGSPVSPAGSTDIEIRRVDIASRSVAGSGISTTTPGSAWHFCNATRSAEDSTPATEPSASMRSCKAAWIRPPGILWVEDGDTFNACSTGAGALLHTELGGNIDASLDFLSSLRNADGLVRDHLRADGSIEASIYSYNQGLLMAAALRAGDRRLAEQACEAGDAYFTVDRLWEQAVCFNAIYAKARLRIGDSAQIRDYADRLEVEGRDEHGWFTAAGRYDEGSVLDTAGALQIFTLLRFGHLIQRVV